MTEYCYSNDEESFNYDCIGDLINDISDVGDPIGLIYWRGEKVELTHAECIDVDSFLEQCDERAYEEIGDIYDNCFSDITGAEKRELEELITSWAKNRVKLPYWKVINIVECEMTQEDCT